MTYDPFARGPHPAGVRGGELLDTARDRRLPYEVWYPAAARYAGQDLNESTQDSFTSEPDGRTLRQPAVRDAAAEPGSYPLVLFSHASGGHRRQSSFLCTHLASHGYVVAAVDHVGNTADDMADVRRRIEAGQTLPDEEREARAQTLMSHRVPDVRFLLDAVLYGAAGDIDRHIDRAQVGIIGWSFGGWTALATPEVDERIGAVVGLVPGGASNPVPGVIRAKLAFGWQRQVPTLLLAAENDIWTPVDGIVDIYDRAPGPKQMFVLKGAGHGHFGDVIEDEDGCPAAHAHDFTRGLTLAHLDASLKADPDARRFMAGDVEAVLKARGVAAAAHGAETALSI